MLERISKDLTLRTATPEDADQLADFHEEVFMDEPSGTRAYWIAEWGRDLLTKPHPTFSPSDCLIVEDQRNNRIASSCLYLTSQWQCEGSAFHIGQPEIVGTRKEYRERGLIRKQFDVMHRWADERQHDILVVNGIPHYYRQFGYDMALGAYSRRTALIEAFPKWNAGDRRNYVLRDATPDDVQFVTNLLNASNQRALYSPVFDANSMRYMMFDRNERSGVAWRTAILCKNTDDGPGETIGALMYALVVAIDEARIIRIEIAKPTYWRLALDDLLREFEERARLATEGNPDQERRIKAVGSEMKPNHPAFIFDNGVLGSQPDNDYAWYVRVPDLAKFITKISGTLNRRLENSIHAGYNGELKINLGNSRLTIAFKDGTFSHATNSGRAPRSDATAAFPGLNFLQILFGRRTVADIVRTDADCEVMALADSDLLQTLFPMRHSDVSLSLN